MISKTQKIEVSWGNIEDKIAELLYWLKVIPENQEIIGIKFELPKDLLAREKLITLEVKTREGVQILSFGT